MMKTDSQQPETVNKAPAQGTLAALAGSDAACSKCKFWKTNSGTSGECHRRAPQVVPYTESKTTGEPGEYRESVDSYARTEWPETLSAEWCGEYEHQNDKSSHASDALAATLG